MCARSQYRAYSQGEGSEDRILIHKRVWEDLPAKEFSYGYKWETQDSKFVSKLVRHESSRERETYMGQCVRNPQIPSSDSNSEVMEEASSHQLHLERKQQDKIRVLSEFLRQITCCTVETFKDSRRNDSTRDAGPRPHTLLGRKLSLNCLFAGRNNNNFDLCRPPGN